MSNITNTVPSSSDIEVTERTVIVVADRGHVWVAKAFFMEGPWLHLLSARCVRVWGTQNGLAELTNGPLSATVLDNMMPTLVVADRAVIAVMPCNDAPWAKYLK